MRYKLLAVDMDGTLLDPNKTIRAGNIAAVKKAVDAGVIFTIVTGRPLQGVEKYRHLLWPNAPLITYNGAMVFDPQSKAVLYEKTLEDQAAAEIITLGKQWDTNLFIWSGGKVHVFEENEQSNYYASHSGSIPVLITDEDALIRQGITKILWMDAAARVEAHQRNLQTGLTGNVTYCTSSPQFLEFFHSDVSKGNAVKFLSEYCNISPSEIITIGDEMNDISMLEYAGLGIAMDNAKDEVKAHADFVTLSNAEDGVAHVIDRFLL